MTSRLLIGDSPLDISLLGLIAVIVGGYGREISVPPDTSPHLIRFFSVSPDRTYPAVMPQDKALLLLNDPSTTEATREATAAGGSLYAVWTLVAVVGVLLLLAGPAVAWRNRGDD
ncbi:hypothetical protein [Haloplanus pelagicus]|jgi:hypothetical protein|uniref:hypothetical protein n=1 Tax=Haloplanus pelagicus TaxID=2949995 RepID=UPI00203FA17C|nr:hypothetical protein [Haloplanus sp. HW8-1]